jgi:formiminoglutamate deiminase
VSGTTTIHAETTLLRDGWASDVRISMAGGAITSVEPGKPAAPGDERAAILLPAMPNVHSHAFQRGMAGLAEIRGPSEDTFWSWREIMYRFALTMTPDQTEAVAAQLYMEMLEAGFGRIGEFHYLHHDRDGSHYANLAEMADRIAAAAAETGIALTLLPVFYAHSTFGGAEPNPGQRRFITGRDTFGRLLEASRDSVLKAGLSDAVVGVAPHSLRAVTPDELAAVIEIGGSGPIHIHAAEQLREVEDSLASLGSRPVEWLLANAPVGANWCLIHATHMTDVETAALAKSGAVAGLCPVTEGSLGDGTFPGRSFLAAGGRFGVGSDSNVLIGVGDELRQLEYSQRLKHNQRNVLASPGQSNGRAMFDAALAGGSQALGGLPAGIAPDGAASFVSLDPSHPTLAGKTGDSILDAWIFARADVDCVWVGGRKLVEKGRHIRREVIAERFRRVMKVLAG